MIQTITLSYLLLTLLNVTHGLTSSICATVRDGNYVRSSRSCNSYNLCMYGRPQHGTCPKGYAFNPTNQVCETNFEVDCRSCSPFGIQHIANPDNCQMYYRCVNGVRTSMTCPNELLFDRNFGDCNVASRVLCEVKNNICEPFHSLGLITVGDPLDCSSYYRCLNGKTFEAACPPGLYYNPYTANCEAYGNFCQGAGPLITTPAPETTTREYVTTAATTAVPTTRTTVRLVYFTTTTTLAPSTTTRAPTRRR
ncbi:Peritrophin-44 [Pseudolycoriella hygida]|uniref:Peritrophin-44 n=1 Tax=Pseudolycoriella hygida TaxID=35572 RepID=A0A9Q0MNC5_9DIPT|nr:Peritrophin-44 [Pseudolycoriella hygida]